MPIAEPQAPNAPKWLIAIFLLWSVRGSPNILLSDSLGKRINGEPGCQIDCRAGVRPAGNIAIIAIVVVLFLFGWASSFCHAAPDLVEIKVGSERDFPPYAFTDESGRPVGFSIDLIKAVADAMNLPIKISTGTWDNLWNDLVAGRLDILPIVAKLPDRLPLVDFSLPHTETYDAFFVRPGNPPVKNIEAAKGKDIVVMRSDAAHHALLGHNFQGNLIVVDTIPVGLSLIAAGKHDAFLCSKLIGTMVLKKLGISNLVAGPVIPDYKRVFSFAVKKGDTGLLEKLNQGLLIIKTNGEYDRIYEKWLAIDDPWRKVQKYFLPATVIAVTTALMVILWLVSLHRLVKKRTRELSEKNELLRLAQDGLETKVAQRTSELEQANVELQTEIAERQQAEEALRESDELYRSLFDNMLNGLAYGKMLFDHDQPQDYIYLAVNHAFETLTGLTDVAGKKVSEIIPGIREADPELFKILGRVALTGKPERFEIFLEALQMWFAISVYSPAQEYFVAVFDVITARKQAEEALRESEDRFRLLVDQSFDGIFIHENYRLADCNQQLSDMTGYSRSELFDIPPIKLFTPDSQDLIHNYITSGKEGNIELELRRKDGQILKIEAFGVPCRFHGRDARIVAFRDITERRRTEEYLRESEVRCAESNRLLAGVLDHTHMMAVFLDPQFNFIWVNRAYANTCRHEPSFFVGKNHFDLYPYEENQAIFQGVVDRGEPFFATAKPFEFPDQPERGVTYWDWSLIPLKNDTGKVTGLVFTLAEVTARKRAELALFESEERFRSFMDNSPTIAWAKNENGHYVYLSKTCEKRVGIRLEDWRGKTDFEVWPHEFAEKVRKDDLLVLESGQPNEFIEKIITPDGNSSWLWTFKFFYLDAAGKKYVGGIALDITERIQMEEALKQSEKRFRTLVEDAPFSIMIVHEGDILYCNPEQLKRFGPPPSSMLWQDFCQWIHPEDQELVRDSMEQILAGQSPPDIIIKLTIPAESDLVDNMFWVLWRGRSIEYLGHRALLLNMVDITQMKILEEQLSMQDKMVSLGHVAAGMAHEIRNPLSGINVYLDTIKELLEESEITGESLELITAAQETSQKIEMVIKRVLDFSRPAEMKLSPINLNESIEEAVKMSAIGLRKAGTHLELSLEKQLPLVFADALRIQQVILNLINNAVAAMNPVLGSKRLHISSAHEEKEVVIKVKDSGEGIPPALRKKVFQPFFTTKNSGSGIGLSLCMRIITDHGGCIEVANSDWGGAEFTLRIPIEGG